MDGQTDGWMDALVPLWMPRSDTSETKRGTDGGPRYQMTRYNPSRWILLPVWFLPLNRR